MGLDITAWRNLERAAEPDPDTDWYDTHVRVTASPHFPGRTEGLADGWYRGEPDIDGEFKAGAYSSYGQWRNWLAKLAGYPSVNHPRETENTHAAGAWQATGGPFWELIEFYDNEGEIGPVVSAKLAGDFAAFDAQAKAADNGWEYGRYQRWRRAFEFAAQGGCVSFH